MLFPNNLQAAESAVTSALNSMTAVQALSESLIMGIALMLVTYWVDSKQINVPDSEGKINGARQILQNSSNVLFMCVAICTVIMLVGNNIARAFALGAAIAMVRFKMKLGENSSGSGLLFAILCGMACGIDAAYIGWILVVGYSVVQITLSAAIHSIEKKNPKTVAPTVVTESSTDEADTAGAPLLVGPVRKTLPTKKSFAN